MIDNNSTIEYAMLGLVKSLTSEYSDKNIQINSISPSMCETKFLDNINENLVELSAIIIHLKEMLLLKILPLL